MVAYIFQSELLCETCVQGWKTERIADHASRLHCHPMSKMAQLALTEEDTGCSDAFPQGPYPNGGGEADSPQHCASCGVHLENPLTEDGMEYVLEEMRSAARASRSSVAWKVWAPFYSLNK